MYIHETDILVFFEVINNNELIYRKLASIIICSTFCLDV